MNSKIAPLISTLFLLVTFNSTCAFSQNHTSDSLEVKLNKLAKGDTNRIEILVELSTLNYPAGSTTPLKYVDDYLELVELLSKKEEKRSLYYTAGRFYAIRGNHPKAVENLQKAYNLIDTQTQSLVKGRIIGMLGYVYYNNELYETAIEYYREVIPIFESAGLKQPQAIAVSTTGSIYFQLKQFEEALDYYKQALNIAESIPDSLLMSTNYTNIGLIYRQFEKPDSALFFTERAVSISEKFNDTSRLIDMYGDLATLHLQLGNSSSALGYAQKSLELANNNGTLLQLRDSYKIMYEVENSTGNKEQALDNYVLFKSYSDSVINTETRQQVIIAQEQFEAERKQQEINLLEAEAQSNKLRLILGLSIAFGIIIILSITYWQYIQRKTREREIEVKSIQRELSNYGHLIAEKDSFLKKISSQLRSLYGNLKTIESKKQLNSMISELQHNINLAESGDQLFNRIEQVNSGFFQKLEQGFSGLTKREKRLASLVNMDLSNKEIGSILGINSRSVVQAKYRLKKKLNLSTDEDLDKFLNNLTD